MFSPTILDFTGYFLMKHEMLAHVAAIFTSGSNIAANICHTNALQRYLSHNSLLQL